MISELLDAHFISKKQAQQKHLDRLFPTQSSTFIAYPKYKKLEGKCMRAAYYHCMGMEESPGLTLRNHLIFKMGDYTEKMILDILKEKGDLVEEGTKFFNEQYNISGRLDAIIKHEGKEVGLEIKSIGSNKYAINHIFGSKWNEAFPKWQNLFQTIIYCYVFRDRIDEFIILYIRRDTCETKEFIVSLQPKDGKLYPCIDGKLDERFCVEDILERYSQLSEFIRLGILPPKEYQKIYPANMIQQYLKAGFMSRYMAEKYKTEPFGDINCRFCGYSDLCEQDFIVESEEDETSDT